MECRAHLLPGWSPNTLFPVALCLPPVTTAYSLTVFVIKTIILPFELPLLNGDSSYLAQFL